MPAMVEAGKVEVEFYQFPGFYTNPNNHKSIKEID